ncbi:hypothetical protein HGM15179_021223 [Zosterops borbonicus]|uniref:RNase H type-1 domain-containing protein n=1 Tax=Zosterops borbonicus TaxID=364589 RepID=A0A8K1D658_9PASS|nr:hypothetical protein HGM15179_021223 [Zosterops borbonicus]
MLDGTEVRHLGSLSHDPLIDQGMIREAYPSSLWERVLGSVAQRYLCADNLYMQQTQWKTIEQGIQRLREMAGAEMVFSDDINTRNPDLVPGTPLMWQKLVQVGPQEYSSALAIMKQDDTEETVLDMVKELRAYADAVHGPTHTGIAALETCLQKLEGKIEENHNTLREEIKVLKEGFLQISAVQIRSSVQNCSTEVQYRGSGTKCRHAPDREGRGIPQGRKRKWKAAVWSPTRQVAEATQAEGGSRQLAELKAIQFALDIAEREKWPKLYVYTDLWMLASALWGWLKKWKKANWQHRGKPNWAQGHRGLGDMGTL